MSKVTRKFKREELFALGLPDEYMGDDEIELLPSEKRAKVISDQITGTSRWSNIYTLVFQLPDQPDDEAYQVSYKTGATECQDESPWEYEKVVTASLVRRVERVVKVWEPVAEATEAKYGLGDAVH